MDGDPISQVRESALIDAPVGVVWRLVTDVGRHPEFAGPKSVTKAIEYEGPLVPGTRWVTHEKFGPRGTTHLEHTMDVLEPRRGAISLKLAYALLLLLLLPASQRRGVLTTLANIKRAAEAERASS